MNPVQITLLTFFHPTDGFCCIKSNRENWSYIPTLVLAVLFAAVRIVSLYLMHYSVSSVQAYQVDVAVELAVLVLPVISWVVVHYSITTISSGECKMREVLAGLVYAFVPYILFTVPIALLSHLYSQQSAGTITTLNSLVMAYCIFQVLISIKAMNDFSLKKTLGMVVVTVVGIVLCWVLIMLLYGLTGQFIKVVVQILVEFVNIYIK